MKGQLALRFGVVVCAVLGYAAAAQCALITGYSGSSTTLSTATGITGESLSLNGGVTQAGGSNFSTRDWETGTTLNPNKYIEFGFTAASTTQFPSGVYLSNLLIAYGNTGSGPIQLRIDVKINSGSFQTIWADNNVVTPATSTPYTINVGSFQHVTSAVFRLYAYNAKNTPGQLDFGNFNVGGNGYAIALTGAATPEPTSLAAFGVGALAAGYYGWRRRKATSAHKA